MIQCFIEMASNKNNIITEGDFTFYLQMSLLLIIIVVASYIT